MKISKKVLEQARSHVSNVTKPVTTGTYNLTLLHASWNEKNGYMNLFLGLEDGRKINVGINFKGSFEGESTTEAMVTKLTALSGFVGSKVSTDTNVWATELCKAKGGRFSGDIKVSVDSKGRTWTNLGRVYPVR